MAKYNNYFPESRTGVYCVRLNFNVSKLTYSGHNSVVFLSINTITATCSLFFTSALHRPCIELTLSRTSTLRWSIRSIHWSMMFPWKPSLIQNLFRHKFSLLVVEPSQSGKRTSYDRSTNCDLFYGISGTRAAKRAVRTEPHTHIGKQKKHMNCFSQGYHGETMSLIITKRLMRTEFIVSSCLENLALFLWKLFRFLV